jgi:hypothetical protein
VGLAMVNRKLIPRQDTDRHGVPIQQFHGLNENACRLG